MSGRRAGRARRRATFAQARRRSKAATACFTASSLGEDLASSSRPLHFAAAACSTPLLVPSLALELAEGGARNPLGSMSSRLTRADFTPLGALGSGGTSEVLLVRKKQGGTLLAMKMIAKRPLNSERDVRRRREPRHAGAPSQDRPLSPLRRLRASSRRTRFCRRRATRTSCGCTTRSRTRRTSTCCSRTAAAATSTPTSPRATSSPSTARRSSSARSRSPPTSTRSTRWSTRPQARERAARARRPRRARLRHRQRLSSSERTQEDGGRAACRRRRR